MPVLSWSAFSPEFELLPGEIHVWNAKLDFSVEDYAECRGLLDSTELARADRFLRAEDRLHFSAARGLLRRLLAWYLKLKPEELRFVYGPQGRPELAPDLGGGTFSFNVSHSDNQGLFAFARDRTVGVDLEIAREEIDDANIAKRYFHPEEAAWLSTLTEARRREEFFRLWTRKEALLKAKGLSVSDIDVRPEADPHFLVVPLELGGAYAALAYGRPEATLRLFCRV